MSRHANVLSPLMIAIAPVAIVLAAIAGPATARAADPSDGQRVASIEVDRAQGFAGVDTTSAMPDSVPAAAGLVMQAHAQMLRPAPLPDQDFDAPGPSSETLAAQKEASVQPSFYSRARHFSGDGFADGSTLEGDQANRHRPGGGMSLSIPMP